MAAPNKGKPCQIMTEEEEEATPTIVDMGTSSASSREVYNSWARRYESDIHKWGYSLPDQVARLLEKYVNNKKYNQRKAAWKILDAGAGSGLSGIALQETLGGFTTGGEMIAMDVSPEMLQITDQRKCYSETVVGDLNETPFPYWDDDSFDIVTCVGTLTYVDPKARALSESVRICRSGGYICYTNRTDKLLDFEQEEQLLEVNGKWKLVDKIGPVPYLPSNPDYGDKIQVVIYLFMVL